jgi:hypothetical protein
MAPARPVVNRHPGSTPPTRHERATAIMMTMYEYSDRLIVCWGRNRGGQAADGA